MHDSQLQPELGMTRNGPVQASRAARQRLLAAVVAAAWIGVADLACADAKLPALNSYAQPPFMPVTADRPGGLAGTFVELVNQALSGMPEFHLENLPRRRLELVLGSREFSGVALFLAPEFLVASAQQGGMWSEPVMADENLIVSVRPLNISSLRGLHGLKVGGITGHIYRMLGPLIDEGKILREDAPDHLSNLRKLCLGRVDFVIISRSELAGTTPHVSCPEAFRPTAFPEPQVIIRRVLVKMPNGDGSRQVLETVATVACGAQWIQALAQYGLSTVGCRHTVARPGDPPPAKATKGRTVQKADEERS